MRLCLVLLAAAAAAKRQQPPAPAADGRELFREALQERDFKTALKTAPAAYATWWQQLLKDDPYHVFIETLLIAFLLYLLYGTRRAKNSQKKDQALTDREIDDLVKDWAPAPLVGTASAPPPAMRVVTPAKELGRVHVRRDTNTAKWQSGDPLTKPTKQGALNCGAFDFLAMGSSTKVREAAQAALTKYGCGSCGPRGFYGSIDVHEQLEARVASFSNTKQAIAFSDAASCCTSTVAAFAKRGDLLVVDDGISEPLRTGCVLSRARVVAYKHNDAQDLKRVMEGIRAADRRKGRAPTAQRRFVVCEAVSRDHGGDVAPLKEILALKDEFGYRLILDESLSWGVLGATGRGLKEACGIEDPTSVEITCVDLAPALGSNGGLCIGTDEVVAHQRLSGAGYCFSAAAPPFYSAAALAALDILDSSEGQKRLSKLRSNASLLRKELAKAFDGDALLSVVGTNIEVDLEDDLDVPFVLLEGASSQKLDAIIDAAYASGYAVSLATPPADDAAPALPPLKKKPLALRVTVTADHSETDVKGLVAALAKASAKAIA